ncbi:MAG: ATP phosphoribosyltransferase catalytic subunit HisG, partial [Pseudomonadota bacterium]|nr:ATP phosphoribosyltransferase catalytic subunit HisG [Pseudomonadota bacterium]
AVADITSTGDTLRANHLKILSDATILKSQATLFRSRMAAANDSERAVIKEMSRTLRLI